MFTSEKEAKIHRFDQVTNYMAPSIRLCLSKLDDDLKSRTHEVRLRTGAPLMITLEGRSQIPADVYRSIERYVVTREDMLRTFELITDSSAHTILDELCCGFVTLSGGDRVGVCGRTATDGGKVISVRDVSSMNFRISHEIKDCADGVMNEIVKNGRVRNTLVVSVPSCGKTTLLRDITRQLSDGFREISALYGGVTVTIKDEGLQKNEITQIKDIAVSQTGVGADKVKILEIK